MVCFQTRLVYVFHCIAWSKKWEENHKKGPEYGALKTAMYAIMIEGDQLADIHHELHEKLMNDVHHSVNQWKKDNYHKSLMSYKEVKSSEEGFSKAQKPWVRRLDGGIYTSFQRLSQKHVKVLKSLCFNLQEFHES